MSMTLLVPMCALAFAQTSDLNAKFRAQGFDIVVADADLRTQSGFLPARWRGRRVGFEYDLMTSEGFDVPSRFGSCEGLVSLDFSRPDETVAAYAVAGALAEMSGSGVYDDDGRWLTPEQAYDAAHSTSWWARLWALFN